MLKKDLYASFLVAAWFCGALIVLIGICHLLGNEIHWIKGQDILTGILELLLGFMSMSYPTIRFYRHIREGIIKK